MDSLLSTDLKDWDLPVTDQDLSVTFSLLTSQISSIIVTSDNMKVMYYAYCYSASVVDMHDCYI